MGRVQQLIAVLMVLISLALGWYAWVLGTRTMAEKPAEKAQQRLNVVVAAKPIQAGTPIAADALKLEVMSVRPEGAYDNVADVEGKIPVENFVAGEPILSQRMFGLDKGIAAVIRPGERAVAVKIDEVIGVGNRLNPRDLVDVFATLRRNSDEISESQTKLLLSGVMVLAVGNRTVQGRDPAPNAGAKPGDTAFGARSGSSSSEQPRTVVLAVPFGEVNRLILATENGKVLLALRSPLDKVPAPAEPSTTPEQVAMADKVTLRQEAGGKPKTGGARQGSGVEVIRGLGR